MSKKLSKRMTNKAAATAIDTDTDKDEHSYCILMHVVEVVGLNGIHSERGDAVQYKLVLGASLKGLKYEVAAGNSIESITRFNCNYIWDHSLTDIKKMKMQDQPLKLQFFAEYGSTDNSPRELIASQMLPLRSMKFVGSSFRTLKTNLHWYRLAPSAPEWRKNKPEVQLLVVVVKRDMIDTEQICSSLGTFSAPVDNSADTVEMLRSTKGVYVEMLDNGMLQVGNDPDPVTPVYWCLTFTKVRNLLGIFGLEKWGDQNVMAFEFDLLGSLGKTEENILHRTEDAFTVNERLRITFQTSLPSLREYLKRVFYVPIYLYMNSKIIASAFMSMSRYLPECDKHFESNISFAFHGSFAFERFYLRTPLSADIAKPTVDFVFKLDLVNPLTARSSSSAQAPVNLNMPDLEDAISLDYPAVEMQHLIRPLPKFEQLELAPEIEVKTSITDQLQQTVENALDSEDNAAAIIDKPTKSPKKCFQNTEGIAIDIPTNTLNMCNAAVNTDIEYMPELLPVGENSLTAEEEEITMKIVQELQEWKEQQMEIFVNELQLRGEVYMANLDHKLQQQRALLHARLQAKITKCEILSRKLQKACAELTENTAKQEGGCHIVSTIRKELESKYAQRFEALEAQVQELSAQAHANSKHDTKYENGKLERENIFLQLRFDKLEDGLVTFAEKPLSKKELQDIICDLRVQNDRFTQIQKEREFYKEQWEKSTLQVQQLKLHGLRQEKCDLQNETKNELETFLEKILNEDEEKEDEEQMANLIEMESIKEELFGTLDCDSTHEDDIEIDEGEGED